MRGSQDSDLGIKVAVKKAVTVIFSLVAQAGRQVALAVSGIRKYIIWRFEIAKVFERSLKIPVPAVFIAFGERRRDAASASV
ncbi:hypothetical protein D9M72_427310 [compost metagenome]